MLAPFNEATAELSEEKRVSGSKVIPMTKMLNMTQLDTKGKISNMTATPLGQNLLSLMQKRFNTLESQPALVLSTLLDPTYKTVGFYNQVQAQTSMKRLTSQCSQVIRSPPPDVLTEELSTSAQPAPENPSSTGNVTNEFFVVSCGKLIKCMIK